MKAVKETMPTAPLGTLTRHELTLTVMTLRCLEKIVTDAKASGKTSESVSGLIERLCREHKEMKACRNALGYTQWDLRKKTGRPRND